MKRQNVGVGNEGHGVTLTRLIVTFAIGRDLNEKSSAGLEIFAYEIVEANHVILLAKVHVIGDVLQDLGHEHEAAFDVGRRLLLHNAHFVRRHDRRVDEPEEHDGADGSNVALLTRRESLAKHLIQTMTHRP